jgi:hypothetical protein
VRLTGLTAGGFRQPNAAFAAAKGFEARSIRPGRARLMHRPPAIRTGRAELETVVSTLRQDRMRQHDKYSVNRIVFKRPDEIQTPV